MVAIGFGVLWLGYQQIIYGWVLLKGWDIRWRDLANPLAPYQWPAPPGSPQLIPQTQILPKTTATGPQQSTTPAKNSSGG